MLPSDTRRDGVTEVGIDGLGFCRGLIMVGRCGYQKYSGRRSSFTLVTCNSRVEDFGFPFEKFLIVRHLTSKHNHNRSNPFESGGEPIRVNKNSTNETIYIPDGTVRGSSHNGDKPYHLPWCKHSSASHSADNRASESQPHSTDIED